MQNEYWPGYGLTVENQSYQPVTTTSVTWNGVPMVMTHGGWAQMQRGNQMENEMLRGMDTVRVDRMEVIKKLEANKEGHRGVFEEALEGFHIAVIQHLDNALKDAKKNKKYTIRFNLPEPQDHTPDYDRMIQMLQMSKDDELELTAQQFAQYVLDDWGWKGDFIGTSTAYLAANRAR